MKGWLSLLTNTEIEKRLDKAEDNKDYVQLYIDMFDEEPPITASNWGAFPIEEIIDAIEDKKPIKKEKLYEEDKIVF